MGWSTNRIAAELAVAATRGDAEFHEVYEQVQTLPLDVKQAVYARLSDTTPNPTGDR